MASFGDISDERLLHPKKKELEIKRAENEIELAST